MVSPKRRRLRIVIVCGLLLGFAGAVNEAIAAKEVVTQTDPYSNEVTMNKDKVTISKGFLRAIKKDNAIILSKVAVRQRRGRDGRLDAWELVEIEKGSVVAKMGFRSGDRLKSINGIPVSEFEAKRTYLEASRRWEFSIYRRKRPQNVIVEVRD